MSFGFKRRWRTRTTLLLLLFLSVLCTLSICQLYLHVDSDFHTRGPTLEKFIEVHSPPPRPLFEKNTVQTELEQTIACFVDEEKTSYSSMELKKFFPPRELRNCPATFAPFTNMTFSSPPVFSHSCNGTFHTALISTPMQNERFSLSQSAKFNVGSVDFTGGPPEEIMMFKCEPTSQFALHLRVKRRNTLSASRAAMRKSWLKTHPDAGWLPEKASIIYLNYDSVSRSHFFRKLVKTSQLLKSLPSSYQLVDFKLHHVIGDNTLPNMRPFIYGGTGGVPRKSLFESMAEAGFVTGYIQDGCDSSLSLPGIKNPADHSPNSVWCLARNYFKFSCLDDNTRCLGDRPSSQHALEYIRSFQNEYLDNSRFVFSHMSESHELTGSVIATADEPLFAFLSELTSRPDPDTLVIIASDHGMRYGGWRRSQGGFIEHKIPPLFMLIPTSWGTGPIEALQHNSHLLNTKLDLHVSLNHMLSLPGYLSHEYQELLHAQTLFEPISTDRSCLDAAIPPELCVCMSWNRPGPLDICVDDNCVGRPTGERVAESAIAAINNLSNRLTYCGTLQLDHVDYMEIQQINPADMKDWIAPAQLERNVKVSFSTKAPYKEQWEVGLNVRAHGAKDLTVSEFQGFPSLPGDHKTEVFTIRFINRPSEWPLECRNRAVGDNLDPKYCVCSSTAV